MRLQDGTATFRMQRRVQDEASLYSKCSLRWRSYAEVIRFITSPTMQKVMAAYCQVYGVIHFTSPAG